MAAGFLATTPAAAAPPPRMVFVVAQPGDPRALRQRTLLRQDAAALHERDVVVEALTPAEAAARPALDVDPHLAFAVLLVGRDGNVKLRRDTPVAAREITALIDTMPMRQAEMRLTRPSTPPPAAGDSGRPPGSSSGGPPARAATWRNPRDGA